MRKKYIRITAFVILICLFSITSSALANNTQAVLPGFSIENRFYGSGSNRVGYCGTGISQTSGGRGNLKCQLQNGAGTTLAYREKYSFYTPGSWFYLQDPNHTTGRLVLFSTHDQFGADGSTAVEYRMSESNG